jgi:hypothetical protein
MYFWVHAERSWAKPHQPFIGKNGFRFTSPNPRLAKLTPSSVGAQHRCAPNAQPQTTVALRPGKECRKPKKKGKTRGELRK